MNVGGGVYFEAMAARARYPQAAGGAKAVPAKKAAPAQKETYAPKTPEEIKAALDTYMEIAAEFVTFLGPGEHIRYETTEGEFRMGGYVMKNPVHGVTEDTKGKVWIRLNNGFARNGKGYAEWLVEHKNLAKVYVRMSVVEMAHERSLEEVTKRLNDNVKKMSEFTMGLEARISALEARKR